MTREEAIEVFKTEHPYNPERKDNDLHTLAKAFDMAMSALSVSENTDLISREKALEMVEKNKQQIAIYRAIEALPSADMRGE